MTSRITVHEAKTNLSELLRRVERGEEIIIARGDAPVAVLSAYAPIELAQRRRAGAGCLAGLLAVPDDTAFFSPLTNKELEQTFGDSAGLFK